MFLKAHEEFYMKSAIALAFFLPTLSFACPNLAGHYYNCHSEIRPMKGDYKIEQYNVQGTEVYEVRYTDEDGDIQDETFKTDGQIVKKKQTIPSIGIKVLVEASATCSGDNVISNGKAYYLGSNVGNYSTTIFKKDRTLKMKITAQYLGKNIVKLIECKE